MTSTTAVRTRVPLTAPQRLLAIGLVLGVSLVAFETTAAVTALPTIADELGGDSLYGVALASYTLANLVALVIAGQVADRRGPTLPYLLSIATFIAGLLLAGFAGSMIVVVIGRTLQGAGTGGFAPIAYMLIKRAFPTERQAGMYAIIGAGWVLPSLVAPAFAGFVTDHFGWEWVFLGIIPLAVAVGALASRPMMSYGPVGDATTDLRRIWSAIATAVGVGMVVTGIRSPNAAVAISVSVAGLAVSIPALRGLLPHGFLRARRGFPAILACRLIATATFLGVDSFVPLAADRVHGARPLVQGFVIVGAAITWSIGQWWSSRRPDANPARLVAFGFALMLLGIVAVFPVLWPGWPLWATFLAWPVGGFGMGILFNPCTVAAMSYAADGREGMVSSQVQLCDSLGFSLMGGIGGAAVAFADRGDLSLRTALGSNFVLAAMLALLGIAASRGVRRAT